MLTRAIPVAVLGCFLLASAIAVGGIYWSASPVGGIVVVVNRFTGSVTMCQWEKCYRAKAPLELSDLTTNTPPQ